MNKDLEFIRKHVKEWPEDATSVRLDCDGEICFMRCCDSKFDFFPDGFDVSMFKPDLDYIASGVEYTKKEVMQS